MNCVINPIAGPTALSRVSLFRETQAIGDAGYQYRSLALVINTDLVSFGERIIMSFDPKDFGLIASVEDIDSQLLIKPSETTQKPQKVISGYETVCRIITEGDGRTMPCHFDPQVLKAFKTLADQFAMVYEQMK